MIVAIANNFALEPEKGLAEGKRIPFSIWVCPNPICKCQQLTLFLDPRPATPDAGIDAAPRSEFSFDFRKGCVSKAPKQSAAANKRVDDFLEGSSKADFDELLEIFKAKKQSIIYEGPLSEVPEDWHENFDASVLIGFHELFPLADHLQFEYDGVQYWVEDSYCIREGCDCRKMSLSFARTPKNANDTKIIQLVSECAARYDLADSSFHSEKPKDSAKIQTLMAQFFAQCPGAKSRLEKRYARVRQLVAERPSTKSNRVNSTMEYPKVAVAASRIGRNDPCPCGSGKKYKKCCGA